MTTLELLELSLLAGGGLLAGILAGFLGIGGGTVLVPFLVALAYQPVQAVATSSLVILVTATSGSMQNWLMGTLSFQRVIYLGLPALLTAPVGAYVANYLKPYILLLGFGLFLVLNIFLVEVRKRITSDEEGAMHQPFDPILARILTGSTAGLIAGMFGVGGGVIMVPLQIVLLGETIKVAIQTSLGVIAIAATSACVGHFLQNPDNLLLLPGLVLGMGGLVGAQISTRFLPRLPDEVITIAFRSFLAIMAIYILWEAWNSYRLGL
ncbi:MAG: sulfite exporter TauE/SafE family protein [Hormoscilla sp. SP5CHS1]|nr:sulfite exporter TauE/SafE family protein [Hormoscilla sp. SP12CHS1]MBC6452181.1 sulfite exporter TauE/SafE family protein [Hormoscilla sp. SP5CHS1]